MSDRWARLGELVARLRDTEEERTIRESLDLLDETQALARAEVRQVLAGLAWWKRWPIRVRLLRHRLRLLRYRLRARRLRR